MAIIRQDGSRKKRDGAAIVRLRNYGTSLFLIILFLALLHITLMGLIIHKQSQALELNELVIAQRADLTRLGRSAQSIVMLRSDLGADNAPLIELNKTRIERYRVDVEERDRRTDDLVERLGGPFFPTDEILHQRVAYDQVVTIFLDRVTELGTEANSPLSRTWTLPDLAIAPHGVLLTSLTEIERITRSFSKRWGDIQLLISVASVMIVASLAALLIFRFFQPLTRRAAADFLELQSTLDVRTRYFHQMSHELRTPLNAINGYAELINMRAAIEADVERAEQSEIIICAARRLTQRVEDILLMSELQSGARTLAPVLIDLAGVVGTAISREALTFPGVRFASEITANTTKVYCDGVDLNVIISHLIRNAAFHTRGFCAVNVKDGKNGPILEIVDDGFGINEGDLARILEPFHTTANAVHETDSGPGLGLSIVKALADANDIGFAIEGRPGGGTIARLTFKTVIDNQDQVGADMVAAEKPAGTVA